MDMTDTTLYNTQTHALHTV